MKFVKKCQHCGHIEVAYTYTLNKPLINTLRRLVDFYEANRKPAEPHKLNLTNSQYGNFSSLQHFGLILQSPDGWYPTNTGIEFIYGEVPINMPVKVMQGKILPPSHEAWRGEDNQREYYIKDINQDEWKRRPAYAAEKSNGPTLFD